MLGAILLAASWLWMGCATSRSGPAGESPDSSFRRTFGLPLSDTREGVVEATSLLGRPLVRPAPDEETRARLQANLDEAWERLRSDMGDELGWVWLGRRLAYLGRYGDAIAVYSEGLRRHPDSHRLRRHRGHRYITTRMPDLAIADLREAERIVTEARIPDEVEPDGAPNELGIPLTTTHSNIYYHLALAHYLKGDYAEALAVHERGAAFGGDNDDQRVSRGYWVYRTLRELGRREDADVVLRGVLAADPEVIENHAYLAALRAYASGDLRGAKGTGDGVQDATLLYGLAAEIWADGRETEARTLMTEMVLRGEPWAAFGFIAAEARLSPAGGLQAAHPARESHETPR